MGDPGLLPAKFCVMLILFIHSPTKDLHRWEIESTLQHVLGLTIVPAVPLKVLFPLSLSLSFSLSILSPGIFEYCL